MCSLLVCGTLPCANACLCVYKFPKLLEICELVHCHRAGDKSRTCQRFSSNKHTDGLQRVSVYLLTAHAARVLFSPRFFPSSGVSGKCRKMIAGAIHCHGQGPV